MLHSPSIVVFLFLPLFSLSYSTTCYDRAGEVLSAVYLPCDNATAFSSCCALERRDGGPADVCTTAGLCLRQDITPGFLYIHGCTDESFADLSCPKFCSNSSQSVVQACDDVGTGTWCCRARGEPSCCDKAFTTNVGVLVMPSQTTVTISPRQTNTTVSTLTKESAAMKVPSSYLPIVSYQCPTDGNEKLAVVTGKSATAVMSVAFSIVLGTLVWREKTRPTDSTDNNIVSGDIEVSQGFIQKGVGKSGPHEMGSQGIYELGGNEVSC